MERQNGLRKFTQTTEEYLALIDLSCRLYGAKTASSSTEAVRCLREWSGRQLSPRSAHNILVARPGPIILQTSQLCREAATRLMSSMEFAIRGKTSHEMG